jgi:signal transduction histidine kinase
MPDCLQLEIEDHGGGFSEIRPRQGIGLVAMRERAELLGGKITFKRPGEGGTLVTMMAPRERMESNA